MIKVKCFIILLLHFYFKLTIYANDLPLWMETSRIQPVINSFYPVNRLPISNGQMYKGNENTEVVFSNAFKTLRSMGITAVTELTKDNWRPPIWPSAVPSMTKGHPEKADIKTSILNKSADVVLMLSQNAQANGVRLGGYYWGSGEGRPSAVDTHTKSSKYIYKSDSYQWSPPSAWLCKNLDGSLAAVTLPNGAIRGFYFDFTSPFYRKFILQRLRELSHRGVDNIFFDERHQPNHEDDGCFGGATEFAYIMRFGESEMPREKDFNGRKYRQYISFQGQKLAETFKYWKTELEKEFGDDRPLFTINGLYLSGFTFPHMSLDLLEVADSVKVEFRNGVRDFISEGFRYPDIDPVFRPPVKLSRPANDIRTAMAFVIARDGANGRPFTSWAVEHDFDTKEKATVMHATVAAYGGIMAPNINFKNMSSIVLNQKIHKTFTKNLMNAVKLVKKMETSLSFSRPYKFAAIHLSEAQRSTKVTGASIWQDIMWPVHSAFEFFVRQGLSAGIITDKQIKDGRLNDYKIVYFTVGGLEKLPFQLKNKVREFQKKGGIIIWKEYDYKIGRIPKKLINLSKLIKSLATVRVDYGNNITSNINPHAIFFSKNKGDTDIVAVLNDFTHILHRQAKSKNKSAPKSIKNARILLGYKPFLVKELISNKTLDIVKLDSGKYQINIPEFQTVTLISIRKIANNPQPRLEINPKFARMKSKVTAEIYLDENSCLGTYTLDWGDGSTKRINAQQDCPKVTHLYHQYNKSSTFPVTLSLLNHKKNINLRKNVNIKDIACSLIAKKKIVKRGQSVKLTWNSKGGNIAILSHGVGLVPQKGQTTMITPIDKTKIAYQLMIYSSDMRHNSFCSTSVKLIN